MNQQNADALSTYSLTDRKGLKEMLEMNDTPPQRSTADVTETEFLVERDRVCADFSAKDSHHQLGQLTGVEYAGVCILLVAAYVLILILQ